MNTICEWAAQWGIPQTAINDLIRRLTPESHLSPLITTGAEGEVQAVVRLEASRKEKRLWRNNVGAVTVDKRHIRYGLCNESAAMNEKIKSSDLIGIDPIRIKPWHVGRLFGRFIAREIKRVGWTYRGTKRERAQLNFLTLVQELGGDAAFASGEGTL